MIAAARQPSRFAMIEAFALHGLRQELACYPKPGLVSFVDTGSHTDMDAGTFLRSILALRGYFEAIAMAGADAADFSELNALGRHAEEAMLAATGGRNTHRGAIFTLGLLAAGAGACATRQAYGPAEICAAVRQRWGAAILAMERGPLPLSHGIAVRRLYGVAGAREQAAGGFPDMMQGLAEYRRTRARGGDANASAVQALFAVMARLPDNNLLYRGRRPGLAFAQAEARAFLASGGMLVRDGRARAIAVHRRFTEANLSPGGTADMLAAIVFLDAWESWGAEAWASR